MADGTSSAERGEQFPRYCPRCGEIFQDETACPNCHERWLPSPPADLGFLARFLSEIGETRRRRLLDAEAYRRIRQDYEERVLAIRPRRQPVEPIIAPAAPPPPIASAPPPSLAPTPPPAPPPSAPPRGLGLPPPVGMRPPVGMPPPPVGMPPTMTPATAQVLPARVFTAQAAIPPRPSIPPRAPAPPKVKRERTKPPVDVNKLVRAWAAKRQADLLLYLGAFLLTIAAILFVNYQGGASGVKSSFFAVYTLTFLVLGLTIARWPRVKEASPVFIALGALLTPLNFVMLWVDVLGDHQFSQPSVWLAGSTTTAALYTFLALRGYGRFYLIPGVVAALVAWGSLAATIHVGNEWYGAWYATSATVLNLLGCYRFRGRRLFTELPAAALALPAVGWAVACAIVSSEHDFLRGELPITLALLLPGVSASAHRYRSTPAFALLPVLGAAIVGTSAWAAGVAHLASSDWVPLWVALAAAGYVGVAAVNRQHAVEWASIAATVAGGALLGAHLIAAAGGDRAALPSTYALSTAGVLAAWLTWRWEAAGVLLPALLATTVATGLWSASLFPFEWVGCTVASAGLGYLALVRLQPPSRGMWRQLALVSAALGIAAAHLAAGVSGIQTVELAVTYAVVLAGAAWAGGFDRDDPALLLVPGAVTGLATSTLWTLAVPQAQWAWPALVTAAAVVLAAPWWRGRGLLGAAGWPTVLALALAPLLLIGPFRDAPETAAGAFAAAGLLWVAASVLSRGALVELLANDVSPRAAVLEQRALGLGAGALFLGSLAYAVRALEWEALPVAWSYLAAGVACWLVAAALGRKLPTLNGILGPVGAAAVGVAVVAAAADLGQEAVMLGIASLAASLAVQPPYRADWRGVAAVCGGGALFFGHAHAAANGTDAWQLPAAYGFVLAAFLWDAVVSRNDVSWLGVPVTGGMGMATTLWFFGAPLEHQVWPATGFALAIELSEPWWSRKAALARAGWPYALLGALVPLGFIGVYLHAPWAGAGALGGGAVVWLVAAVFSKGALASIGRMAGARDVVLERRLLAWGSAALAMGSVAFVDRGLGWSLPESAWGFAGAAAAAWLAAALLGRRAPELNGILGPAGAAAMAVGFATAYGHAGQEALMLGSGGLAAALAVQPGYLAGWRGLAAVCGGGALLFGHAHAAANGTDAWQLPAAYGFVLAAFLWDAVVSRNDVSWLGVPVTGGMGMATTLWFFGAPLEHQVWPATGFALAIELSEPWWSRKAALARAGWPYALLGALVPLGFIGVYLHAPWAGAGALGGGAVVWLVAAVFSKGALTSIGRMAGARDVVLERRLLAWGSAALAMGSVAFVDRGLGWSLPESAWGFAGAAAAAWLAAALLGRRAPELNGILGPAGAAAMAVAFATAYGHAGQEALMLGSGGLAAALAVQPGYLAGWRGLAAVCGGGALFFGHAHAAANGTDAWQLPAAYGFVLAAFLWDAVVSRNDVSWLGVPVTGGMGMATTLWFFGAPLEHQVWPATGFALAIELSEPWWSRKAALARAGWPYALLGALVPLGFIGVYLHAPWAGAGALGGGAVVWLVAAVFSKGALTSIGRMAGARDVVLERRLLAWGSAALAMGSVAFVDRGLGWSLPESAWGFAGAAAAAWLAAALLGRRAPELNGILGPAGAAAMAVGFATAYGHAGQEALMLGSGGLAAALAVQPGYLAGWRGLAAVCGGGALFFGHAHAAANGTDAWQLPAAYGFVLAAFLWDAVVSRNDVSWLGVPVTGGMGMATTLWFFGAPLEHQVWPATGFALAIELSEPWWSRKAALARAGWPYALLGALVPLGFVGVYLHAPWAGAGALAVSALVWAIAAGRSRGAVLASFLPAVPEVIPFGERAALGLTAAALLFGAAGFFSRGMDWSPYEAAWPYVAIGAAAWVAAAAARSRIRELNLVLLVTAVAATCVGAGAADTHLGEMSLIVAIGSAGSAIAILGVRRWPMGFLPAAGTAVSLALLWAHAGWDTWSLALAYGGAATALTAALTRWRDWKPSESGLVVTLLSTLPWGLAFVTEYRALVDRADALIGSEALVRTSEWAALVSLVTVAGVALLGEGRRLRLTPLTAAGSLVLLLGLELAIAILEPGTRQAYTAPIALYVMAAALYVRRSQQLFGAHMDRHEAVLFLGEAILVVPGALDALSHSGIVWSLLLIAEAMLLLGVGFLLAQRWLVAGGVLTLVGVAARFYMAGGYQPPFWLTLGVVGLLVLGAGVVLLAARDWWDATRDRVVHWWLDEGQPTDRPPTSRGGPGRKPPHVPPAPPMAHA